MVMVGDRQRKRHKQTNKKTKRKEKRGRTERRRDWGIEGGVNKIGKWKCTICGRICVFRIPWMDI